MLLSARLHADERKKSSKSRVGCGSRVIGQQKVSVNRPFPGKIQDFPRGLDVRALPALPLLYKRAMRPKSFGPKPSKDRRAPPAKNRGKAEKIPPPPPRPRLARAESGAQ